MCPKFRNTNLQSLASTSVTQRAMPLQLSTNSKLLGRPHSSTTISFHVLNLRINKSLPNHAWSMKLSSKTTHSTQLQTHLDLKLILLLEVFRLQAMLFIIRMVRILRSECIIRTTVTMLSLFRMKVGIQNKEVSLGFQEKLLDFSLTVIRIR